MARTGILGGTFDPVHNGHLALAIAAASLCRLSEVLLIPASVPPHKRHLKITSFRHRTAMLEIAISNEPLLRVSTIEGQLPSPSFTIDTLLHLQCHSASDRQLYFIIGADAFFDILTWYRFQEVLAATHFIVFSRSGCMDHKLCDLYASLGYREEGTVWYNDLSQTSIFTSTLTLPRVSSSTIRECTMRGESLTGMTPDSVAAYIMEHALYL